ncbi:MAG: hypothetical protein DRN00_03150 [Thermoplasmata archaeon]|nr:MAG: hypothetical protein DRN00_03150 [Thermoplasmata archaeon]
MIDIMVYVVPPYRTDDPTICTAVKLVRLGYARLINSVREVSNATVVLNPLAKEELSPKDREKAEKGGILLIDCPWETIEKTFLELGLLSHPNSRALPPLMAANPHYRGTRKLSSAEAIAASLYILGYQSLAYEILSHFNWGWLFWMWNLSNLACVARGGGSGR